MLIRLVTLLCIALSHGPFTLRLIRRTQAHEMPSTREFVIASFLLYYDAGIVLEIAGVPYVNQYFHSMFLAPDAVLALSIGIVLLSPWVIDWGADRREKARDPESAIAPSRRGLFYLLTGAMCIGCVALSLKLATAAVYVWAARKSVAESLGPFILILFMPHYVLAFFVRQRDSHSKKGTLFVGFLVVCAVLASVPVGERTLVLLPFVLVLLFWKRPSFTRFVLVGALGLVVAAWILPFFKWQQQGNSDASALAIEVLNGDLDRGPVLADAVSRSCFMGTHVLDYPGEGYVYSFLLFVPRALAPFKGASTATFFTARVTNADPTDMTWGFGISAIDEILLNFGILFLPLGLLAFGWAIRKADSLSEKLPALLIPTRMSAVFLMGYHLPALLQDFGAMAIVGMILGKLFAKAVPYGKPHPIAVSTEI